nr:restriction endonuclease subunit M [Spirochaetota bacterium]
KNCKEINKTNVIIYDRKDKINFISENNCLKFYIENQNKWIDNNYNIFNIFINQESIKILDKIEINTKPLEYYCDFTLGITPYDKYVGHTQEQIKNRVFHSVTKKNETFKELLTGEDIKRYYVKWGEKEYISYGDWLAAPRRKEFFIGEKIFVRQIISGKPLRIYAAFTNEEYYITQIGFSIISKNNISLKFILAIINSKLMNFYHKNKYLDQSKDLFQKILIQNARKFPIIENINKQMSEKLITLVDNMLETQKLYHNAKSDSDKNLYKQKIDLIDNQIDNLVYKLYGLTEEEIKIVEGEK